MTKKGNEGLPVQFDPLTLSRIKRQAERSFGTVSGAMQSYVRGATMKQLLLDEQAEQNYAKLEKEES
jgi:hypothetical protein